MRTPRTCRRSRRTATRSNAAMPYQPVIDLVTAALDRVSAAALRNLAPVSLAELAALVPEVGERFPACRTCRMIFPRRGRRHASCSEPASRGSERRPSVYSHGGRHPVGRRAPARKSFITSPATPLSARCCVIYAYRDEEVDSDERLARLVESLRRETGARRVPLARLGPADTGRLVAALADSNRTDCITSARPGWPSACIAETEGNPFFLISILQSLSEGETQLRSTRQCADAGLLPDALRAAVRVRLAHVPKSSGRCSKPPRFSAGASISTRSST